MNKIKNWLARMVELWTKILPMINRLENIRKKFIKKVLIRKSPLTPEMKKDLMIMKILLSKHEGNKLDDYMMAYTSTN